MISIFSKSISVSIDESPIPILWLDTSVIIRMTKVKIGERLDTEDPVRYLSLYEKIYSLVCNGKLICPIAEQGEEISYGRRLEKQCYELQLALSRGVEFRHEESIRSIQRQKASHSFLRGEKDICLSYIDGFHEDPCIEIQKTSGFIIGVFGKPGDRFLSKEIESKKMTYENLNLLKKSINKFDLTYLEQLEIEQLGLQQTVTRIANNWYKINLHHLEPTLKDMQQYQFLGRILIEWRQFSGKIGDIEGLLTFLASDEYKILPHVDISSMLSAKLMVNDGKVASGDSMDIRQLSTKIPICKYIIADKKMRNIIHELDIDCKYNTHVFCMHDYVKVMDELDSIEKT